MCGSDVEYLLTSYITKLYTSIKCNKMVARFTDIY